MEGKLKIAIIGGNTIIDAVAADLVSEAFPGFEIKMCRSESSFLEDREITACDIAVTDRTSSLSGWKYFVEKTAAKFPGSAIIIIAENLSRELSADITASGVYDILTPSTLTRLIPVVSRRAREIEAEEKLELLSREKLFSDQITDTSRSMLSIINRDYVYEKVNETFCRAHDTSAERIVGKSLREVWGDETFLSKIRDNVDLCLQGNTVRYESSFNTPHFGNRYYEVIFRPVKGSDGIITHLLAETFDITELKLSQQVVKEMEDEFRKLESNFPIGFLRCDSEGSIIHVNNAFLKIMECDDEKSIAGINIGEFYTEKELFAIHLVQLRSESIKTFGRVSLFTCRGNEIACRISGFVVTGENGEINYIDFAFEDSSRELMLENRLLQAQKLETIGALAGGLAHDFNNILATISGYTEMVIGDLAPGTENHDKLNKVLNAVKKARSLTTQILTFSRQVEQEKIPVNISEVLSETVELMRSGMPSNTEIVLKSSPVTATVFADPTQLFRVFLNLMTNALQAMEENGGTITVEQAIAEGKSLRHLLNKDIVADEYAVISIEDTGTGMDGSVMKRIFEPYFTTKGVGKGTGLGLSVVHGIVSEIEGEILVSSRKERGSVFTLYLPVTAAGGENAVPDLMSKKLLYISGNRHESRILSMALEKKGYSMLFASGKKSLKSVLARKESLPDIILLVDDAEHISPEDLKTAITEPGIIPPVILITDIEHSVIKENFLNSGLVKQLLNKPVSLKEINDAIQLSLT